MWPSDSILDDMTAATGSVSTPDPIDVDELRENLRQADPGVLTAVLAQLTGDQRYAAAASTVPTSRQDARRGYLLQEAGALYQQGDERGDNTAASLAIDRYRALAGATGNARARIFCHRVEAELLAIDSYYRTADEIDDSVRCRSAQAWLEGEQLQISTMN